MQNEPIAEDPKDIWQQQVLEGYKMSLELLRLRAQELARKTRLKFVSVSGVAIAVIMFDVWSFKMSPYWLQRAGFALAVAWSLFALIEARDSIWPSTIARDAGLLTCLSFSRNELQRRLNYSNHIWRGLAGPILFTLGVAVAPSFLQDWKSPEHWLKGVPTFILLAIWAVMFGIIVRRERQTLRREMDELNSLESDQLQRG